jgi:hypothetical protein
MALPERIDLGIDENPGFFGGELEYWSLFSFVCTQINLKNMVQKSRKYKKKWDVYVCKL